MNIFQFLLLGCVFASGTSADVYSLVSSISWVPKTPALVDQSTIFNGTYYLSDRSNAGVHVISLSNNTQRMIIGGFHTGLVNGSASSDLSGPNGLIVLPNRNELYVGDGDGSIKVISLLTNTIIANISTGFQTRADELAYDPISQTVVATNPSEPTVSVSIINATSRFVIGNISFPVALALEQPAFNPFDSKFYVSVPISNSNLGGALAVLNLTSLSVVSTIPVPECRNAGIAFGASNQLFLGCSASQLDAFGFAASYVMDVSTGTIVSNISGVTGNDQVTYSSSTGWFYAAAFQDVLANGTATPRVAVIASNGTLLQSIMTDDSVAHTVAVDEQTGTLVVPVQARGILVYSLAGIRKNTGSSTASGISATEIAKSDAPKRSVNVMLLVGAGIAWFDLLL
ncbi:uncharacterized protein N7458_004362 [Penicillium daleae]|uniref:Uncharacterized protein n=1 Tax=Penicillium daleae TaxID=63821 RepID=A0AAD6C5W4_9EURO|nr:uncharacterized protein N7458_004362 [Penicillium daleae]KAJ5453406.1 hypothetical protein N7458_004362 [Penicillium daleae]